MPENVKGCIALVANGDPANGKGVSDKNPDRGLRVNSFF